MLMTDSTEPETRAILTCGPHPADLIDVNRYEKLPYSTLLRTASSLKQLSLGRTEYVFLLNAGRFSASKVFRRMCSIGCAEVVFEFHRSNSPIYPTSGGD